MQSGKRLTLKDYFAKHTRTHSVIFRQYGVSQSECKIDRPRPGLPRVSPRPHTEALGTRLRLRQTANGKLLINHPTHPLSNKPPSL